MNKDVKKATETSVRIVIVCWSCQSHWCLQYSYL